MDVYKLLLHLTRKASLEVDCSRHLFYDSDIIEDDEWHTQFFKKDIQLQSDLGGRMLDAFRKTLATHDKVVIIGSDCPKINGEIIEEAYDKLESTDIVVGPTFDGGYYLLGMKKAHSFLFENMPWSTENVYKTTVDRITNQALTYSKVRMLSDLDDIIDLNNFPELKSEIKSLH